MKPQIFSNASKNRSTGQPIDNLFIKKTTSKNFKSIILMIAAMGCLTFADLLIKIASQTLPIGQVMLFLGIGSIIVFWGLMSIKGEVIRLSPLTDPAVVLRNFGDVIAINSMCLALVYVPISTIGAVIQTVPLMVTAAAAIFLGEQVGLRRAFWKQTLTTSPKSKIPKIKMNIKPVAKGAYVKNKLLGLALNRLEFAAGLLTHASNM